jgi:uncharacterized membrane protein YfcA
VSRIATPLARRIDRLARRAHAFHRWSHHPLCERYGPEVLRLGRRTRLCRGCSLTALGAVAGLGAGLALPADPGRGWLATALLLLVAVPLAIPRRPRTAESVARRPPKLLTRFLPLAIAGAALAQALAAPAPARLAAAAVAVLATAWGVLRYRRRGPDREPCRGCPEGPPGVRCSGFAVQVRRERAMSRLAGRWIAAAGPTCAAGVAASEPR